jgi:hypothetical protein
VSGAIRGEACGRRAWGSLPCMRIIVGAYRLLYRYSRVTLTASSSDHGSDVRTRWTSGRGSWTVGFIRGVSAGDWIWRVKGTRHLAYASFFLA